MSIKEAISKTTAANFVATVILIGTVAYAVYYKDVEMLKYLAPFAAGYLFGRTVK